MTAPEDSPASAQAQTPVMATVTGVLASAELKVGELVADRFRIESLIGIGGMGVVYRARDEQLEVPVALKLLRPELASRADAFARFRHEILLARQVSSPHVVRLHDIFQHEGRWLLSMDYVQGDPLDRHLDRHGALSVADALKITRQLALGLAAAHQRQVVHRDLKPANVLLNDTLDAYISDFGIALSAGVTRVTGTGAIIGTPAYLSPEQARAEPVDARSDLYTLGLILYEMLTGELPFSAGTATEMLAQRIARQPPRVTSRRADVPAWVDRLTMKMLQAKSSRRFQSAEQIVAAIDAEHVPYQLPAARIATTLAVAALLGGGAWWATNRPAAEHRAATVAPPATAAAAALDLVALPLAAAPADSAEAAAVSDLLDESLLAAGARSADAARVQRSLRQLGYGGAEAQQHLSRVLETVGATRAVAGSLSRSDDHWDLSLGVSDARTPAQPARSGAVTLDVLPLASRQLLVKLKLLDAARAARDTIAWPLTAAGLQAYGEGLLDERDAKDAAALVAFERANQADPGFALAWRHRIDVLQRQRRTAAATQVAQAALAALRDAHGRDVETLRAIGAQLEGDTANAVARFKSLAATEPSNHSLALRYARVLDENGDGENARAERERVVAADPQDPLAWFDLGKAAILSGAAQRGVDDYLIRAQVLYNRLQDAHGQAEVSNALGIGYERLGQVDAALEQYTRSIALREKLDEPLATVNSLRNLAGLQTVRGEFAAAATNLGRARVLLKPLNEPAAMADVANAEGVLAEERGDFKAALAAYREALDIRQPLGDVSLIAESRINVGFAYFHNGEFQDAAIYWQQAEAGYAKADDEPGAVRARQSLSLLALAQGDWKRARDLENSALDSAEKLQMQEEQAVSLGDLAEIDRLEGRIADALQHAEHARALFAQRKDQRGTTEMDLLRAEALISVDAWDAAEASLANLRKVAPSDREQAALLALRSGEIALGRGQNEAASKLAESALAVSTAAHSQPAVIAALALKADAQSANRQPSAANQALAQAEAAWPRHPSRALALDLVESRLRVAPTPSAYKKAQDLLAGLPGYYGAYSLHLAGGKALGGGDPAAATQAVRSARTALDALLAATPQEFRKELLATRASLQ